MFLLFSPFSLPSSYPSSLSSSSFSLSSSSSISFPSSLLSSSSSISFPPLHSLPPSFFPPLNSPLPFLFPLFTLHFFKLPSSSFSPSSSSSLLSFSSYSFTPFSLPLSSSSIKEHKIKLHSPACLLVHECCLFHVAWSERKQWHLPPYFNSLGDEYGWLERSTQAWGGQTHPIAFLYFLSIMIVLVLLCTRGGTWERAMTLAKSGPSKLEVDKLTK